MSDTAFHSGLIKEAFPRTRYGGAKPAIYAAYRYIAPRVTKAFTERRARSIWEGRVGRMFSNQIRALASKLEAIKSAKKEALRTMK